MANPGPIRPADFMFPTRREAILADKCVNCQRSVTEDRMTYTEWKEYRISGYCTDCQSAIFGR